MTRDIILNGRFLSRRVTGVERHGQEILRCIGGRFRVERPAGALSGVTGHMWEQFVLPGRMNPESILWSPANTGPLLIRNQALTIHDLSPLEHPEWFRGMFTAWYRLFLPILARRVRKICTPSEYVKQKVMTRFEIKNVIVTPNAVNHAIFHPHAEQKKYELPKCYVLFVGSIEPRKNLNLLLRAWNEIKDIFKDTWLVIAGASGHIFKSVNMPRHVHRVCFLGYVDDETLPGLYANASLFVLPSLTEGFGLPALEAMACGTPVIASDGGALPETIGDAGIIFALSQPSALSTTMRECLSNHDLRLSLSHQGILRAGKFSWMETSDLIWNALNEI